MSALVEALALAAEIRANWDDPAEWGYQWEHLGDAERDIRRLVDGLKSAALLAAALAEIADMDYRGNRSPEQVLAHRALVAEGLRAE